MLTLPILTIPPPSQPHSHPGSCGIVVPERSSSPQLQWIPTLQVFVHCWLWWPSSESKVGLLRVASSNSNTPFCSCLKCSQACALTHSPPRAVDLNFPVASPEILYHTIWRTWLFITYWDERWLYYRFSVPHSYISHWKVGRMYYLSLGVKGFKRCWGRLWTDSDRKLQSNLP